MTDTVLLYTTSTCHHCPKLTDFLDNLGIQFSKVVIDKDSNLETEALLFGICSVPALKKGDAILKPKDMFTSDDQIKEHDVKRFLKM
ncbi:MAG: glutaredoxin family protein [Candidatus Sigynarchaeota archaeon]